MSVKVPIRTKKSRRSKKVDQPLSDLQFIKKLSDEGKLIIVNGSTTTGTADIVEFVVPQGKTFYFLDSSVTAANGGDCFLEITNPTFLIDLQAFPAVDTNIQFKIKCATIVGNGIRSILIRMVGGANLLSSATIEGYLENSPTLSQMGSSKIR